MRPSLLRLFATASLGVTSIVGLTTVASAHDGSQQQARLVRIQDDCEPQSFNAVLGEGACVGDGRTTFDELVAELTERGEADDWAFSPQRVTLGHGGRLRALNQGGEAHSFTRVRRFGPGCVPEVNEILGFPAGAMVRECDSPTWLRTLLAPGESLRVRTLQPGTHRFECLIHPWMRATVRVQGTQR
jgi:plastocyanin